MRLFLFLTQPPNKNTFIPMSVTSLMKAIKTLFIFFCLLCFIGAGCKEVSEETDPVDQEIPLSNAFTAGQSVGTLQSSSIDEASGLVASRSNSSYLYTHNDSGGDPIVYLITTSGTETSRMTLSGANNVDWEDIAIGPGPDDGLQYLYVGDIGDNSAKRESLMIYRVAEPNVNVANIPQEQTLDNVERIEFVYENGARDAETLLIDPLTKDIYVVSKREAQVGLYVLPFPQSTAQKDTAEFVMNLPFTYFTGGDISASGNEILIKNYFNVYYWPRTVGQTIKQALAIEPQRLNYSAEPQGEAICFAADGSGYFTISEMDSSSPVDVIFYRRN